MELENGTAIVVTIVLIGLMLGIGMYVLINFQDNVFSETVSLSSSQNFTYTTATSLNPVEEGITSNSVQTYNNTFLSFDGVDGYVDTDVNTIKLNSTLPFSYSAWVNVKNVSLQGIMGRWKPVTGERDFGSRVNSNGLLRTSFFNTSGADKSSDTNYTVLKDNWFFLTVVNNGTEVLTYVDGNLVGNITSDINSNSTDSFQIGRFVGGSNYFNGNIDEVRIYNQTLSESEITEIYNSGRVSNSSLPSEGLVAWYSFNEATGTTPYDKSGNNNHGTLTNFE